MKTIKLLIPSILIIALTILGIQSCKKKDKEIDVKASGFVQKGPFVSGSQITIQELDNTLTPTGDVYQTTINDDFGSFSLNSTINSHYIEVIANGYYFNEVSGTLSSGPLTLRALADPDDTAKININILTTLAKSRIEYLMNELGLPFVAARTHAEMEILAIFNINIPNLTSFSEMNIAEPGVSNAILLAISATLQADNTVAKLSELISKIALDIKDDGDIDNQSTVEQILNNGKLLNVVQIRNNIESRYSSLGLSVTIPPFEDYIDSDGDSIINLLDTDQYVLRQSNQNTPWGNRHGKILTFNNKLWMIGYSSSTSSPGDTKIWSSSDGLNWQAEADGPWAPRTQHAGLVYDNKMWLIAGDQEEDVWNTSDGVNWNQISTTTPWNDSHFLHNTCQVFNNKMFVFGGYYHYIVYSSTDGINWNIENNSEPWGLRAIASTFVFNNKIWLCGGEDPTVGNKNDIWNSDDGVTWLNITTSNPFNPTYQHYCEIFDNKVWLISWGGIWKSNDGINYELFSNFEIEPYSTLTCEFNNKLWIYNGNEIYYIEKYN